MNGFIFKSNNSFKNRISKSRLRSNCPRKYETLTRNGLGYITTTPEKLDRYARRYGLKYVNVSDFNEHAGMIQLMVTGYKAAILFTECEPGTDAESYDQENESALHGDISDSDFSDEMDSRTERDCAALYIENLATFDSLWAYVRENYVYIQGGLYGTYEAGIDFWLTRNGHGTGFLDRGLGELGDTLTAACEAFGEVWVYLGDDSRVHIS